MITKKIIQRITINKLYFFLKFIFIIKMDVYLTNNKVDTFTVPYKSSDYNCSILGPNGKYYFVPSNQTCVMMQR